MTTDGQLLIAASSGQKIRVGSLTSANSSVTLTYSEPSTTTNKLDLAVDASGIVLGVEETIARVNGDIVSIFSPRVAKFVVDPTLDLGTHQTISAALTDAVDGEEIFIRPGTYTENLTLKDGVRLTAFVGDDKDGGVTIVGKASITSGKAVLTGLGFQTNGDYCLSATGTGSLEVLLCKVQANDNDAIEHTSSGLTTLRFSTGGPSNGFKLLAQTAGDTAFRECSFSGGDGTVNTIAGGSCTVSHSNMGDFPMATSNAALVKYDHSQVTTTPNNTIALATVGTGTSVFKNCNIASGSAVTVSIGANTTVEAFNTSLSSSNTNTVSGAGTLKYSALAFDGSSTAMNPTTATKMPQMAGKISFNSGADYLEHYEEGTWTPIITGSTGAPSTMTYTTQLGKYTRIGNVVYYKFNVVVNAITGGTGNLRIQPLPFAGSNDSMGNWGVVLLSGVDFSTANYVVSNGGVNSTYIKFISVTTNGAIATIAVTDVANGDTITGSGFYFI